MRMNAAVCRIFVLIGLLTGLFRGHAETVLPVIFADHMVIQRDQPVLIWGWDTPGQAVHVHIGEAAAETVTDEHGRWEIKLPAMAAGGPFEIVVRGSTTKRIEDVLRGEVWLCSGQSNMAWIVRNSNDFEKEQAASDLPAIRHITVPRVPAGLPRKDLPECSWLRCHPDTVGGFSAVATFFGRHLHRELSVPIGLINSSWGGTRIEPWTPVAGFEQVDALEEILARVRLTLPSTAEHKQRLSAHLEQIENWLQDARRALADETVVNAPPAFPSELLPFHDRQHPTALYNGMIHGLVPFGIRGAIWYQGESNHREGMLYYEKMKALIGGWRTVWAFPEMPFYFVQIAPYQYGKEDPAVLPRFWEAQSAAARLPHVGMVVISDVGNLQDIHPRNKQAVGTRLANLALARTYGREGIVWSGPVFRGMDVEPGRLRLHFDHVGGGLASRDGEPLNWFELHDADGEEFVEAAARIDESALVVSAEGVATPVAVRFAWHKLAVPNLINAAGLPAAPFRAGSVPRIDYLARRVDEAASYELLYDLDLRNLGGTIRYDIDRHREMERPFDRVAYFLELKKDGEKTEYVYASMDAFTDDPAKVGIPHVDTGAHFHTPVTSLTVISNVEGIVNGTGLTGGWIEFWPNNYGPANAAGVPGASDQLWDIGDGPSGPVDGYGCMQIHNAEAGQTLLAVNHWKLGERADIGIGNSPATPVISGGNANVSRTRDWTFQANASQYTVRRLRVLARPAPRH